MDLAAGAALVLRDEVVLGRHGERGGSCRTRLRADLAGAPLLRHELDVSGTDEVSLGPAVLVGCRTAGSLLWVGPGWDAAAAGTRGRPGDVRVRAGGGRDAAGGSRGPGHRAGRGRSYPAPAAAPAGRPRPLSSGIWRYSGWTTLASLSTTLRLAPNSLGSWSNTRTAIGSVTSAAPRASSSHWPSSSAEGGRRGVHPKNHRQGPGRDGVGAGRPGRVAAVYRACIGGAGCRGEMPSGR